MMLTLLIAVAFAILFFRAAQYERMSPWLWVIASVAISLVTGLLTTILFWVISAQIALFVGMWVYNARRQNGN